MALVRDPYFWKRFSTAVHLDEKAKSITNDPDTPASEKQPDSWLERERKKSRKSLICGFVIFIFVVLLVVAGVVVWWLAKHHWLQSVEP